MKKNILFLLSASVLITACSSNTKNHKVVKSSEVNWTYLNPARKDKAPMAGTLWGDRNSTEATGFLLKPKNGFESPEHIHNVSYRGVVIKGQIHNDDKKADNMWMGTGSFWTQPAGDTHITAAKGEETLAYIEIDKGPYLVLPSAEKFDNGERAINVDKTNLVWLDESNITWIDKNGPRTAFLWGEPEYNKLNGNLIKLPAGFKGKLISNGESLKAVVIKSNIKHEGEVLEPGSYFASTNSSEHNISCKDECILYVRSIGTFEIK
jgi:mannose-6-phosphate isomerase-like protein (cupin superfamily)